MGKAANTIASLRCDINTKDMSKPANIQASDIRNVVTKEDDFGHEMRVGNLIRSVQSMSMQHGGTYTDPVTKKPRQFDYRCSLTKSSTRLSLAVECKNISPSFQLVVCGTGRTESEAFHEIIEARLGHFRRKTAIINGLSSVTRRAIHENAFYPPHQFVGKSLVQIQADKTPMTRMKDSEIYDKWAQALSSAVGLAESACAFPNGAQPPKFITAILPIVVIPDGLLWHAIYDEKGNLSKDPTQVDECEFFVSKEIDLGKIRTPLFHRFTFSHVHFFSLTGFGSFLSQMTTNDQVWSKLFTDKSVEL
jgi:hypothetical protein